MNEEIKVSLYYRKDRGQFFMQYRDPESGNKVRRSAGTHRRKAAERAAGVWQEELNKGRGRDRKYGRMPWEDFRQLYEDEHIASLAARTDDKITGVLNVLERVVRPSRLGDVNGAALSNYQKWLRDNKRSEATIKSHLAHILGALSWAKGKGLIDALPEVVLPKRARKSKRTMKGRPLSQDEYCRMQALAPLVLTPRESLIQAVRRLPIRQSWYFLLEGLWWSGLRLSEAVDLHWTDRSHICIEGLESEAPMFWVPDHAEKGNEDRILPMAPEFAQVLRRIPPQQRTGFVFNPLPRRRRYGERLSAHHVGVVISKIGKRAGVLVRDDRGKVKYASAHDFRRSFGDRWSQRVMPAVLKDIMRHTDIQTTMRYYVGREAEATAAAIWAAVGSPSGSPVKRPMS